MTLEVEVKVLDVDSDRIRQVLETLGVRSGNRRLLVTDLYDYPDRRLLRSGSYVRIRTDGSNVELTHKSPAASPDRDRHQVMREIKLPVPDPESTHDFLVALGLERILLIERMRTSWRLDDLRFDLDEWPVLPAYLEIEGPSREAVDRGLALLDLPQEAGVALGPHEVFAHYGLDLETLGEIRFEQNG